MKFDMAILYVAAYTFNDKNLKHFPFCIFPKYNCNTILSPNQEVIFTVLNFTFVLKVAHRSCTTNFLLNGEDTTKQSQIFPLKRFTYQDKKQADL